MLLRTHTCCDLLSAVTALLLVSCLVVIDLMPHAVFGYVRIWRENLKLRGGSLWPHAALLHPISHLHSVVLGLITGFSLDLGMGATSHRDPGAGLAAASCSGLCLAVCRL